MMVEGHLSIICGRFFYQTSGYPNILPSLQEKEIARMNHCTHTIYLYEKSGRERLMCVNQACLILLSNLILDREFHLRKPVEDQICDWEVWPDAFFFATAMVSAGS